MKPVQYFSDEYLESCQNMTTTQIVDFLDNFMDIYINKNERTKLISLKVPENLLTAFRIKAKVHSIPYQTQIKNLMKAWL